MSDVSLFNTDDGGEITITLGDVKLDGGLASAAYLSLFGGNADDPGERESSLQWWGNLDETQPSRVQRSRTQHLLQAIPAIPANLLRIQAAVDLDLQWMVAEGAATTVSSTVTMPALNTVRIQVDIVANDQESTIVFTANWRADSA